MQPIKIYALGKAVTKISSQNLQKIGYAAGMNICIFPESFTNGTADGVN